MPTNTKSEKNNMRTKKKKPFLPVVITVCFYAVVVFTIPAVNDIRANRIVHELTEYHTPPNSKVVEMCAYSGKLIGNGDGMDYFGAILIKCDAEFDEVKQNYANSGFSVEKQESRLIEQLDKKTYFKTNITGGNYYIVYKLKWAENPLFWVFDLRGA